MNILNLNVEVNNPFDKWDFFKNLGCMSGKLFQHKFWELEHTYYSKLLVDIGLCWNTRQDHAGFEIVVGILGYGVHFRIYDHRHWDDFTNSWEEFNFDEYTQINR